jgi:hypothetical protein
MSNQQQQGTLFVPGTGALERSENIISKKTTQIREGVLYKAWTYIRGPFLLPPDLVGHSCDTHWEKFDVDKAACTVCSKLHVCHILTCKTSTERDGVICNITGVCLGQRMLSAYENPFDHTVESDLDVFTRPNIIHKAIGVRTLEHEYVVGSNEFDTVLATIQDILLSSKTQKSLDSENEKLINKLRSVCMRRLRQDRIQRRVSNLCDLDTHMFNVLNGHRLPPPDIQLSLEKRHECARMATESITQLICFMRTHCVNIPTCVKHGGIVVGMLYMMRTGVTIDNITVLAKIPTLKNLLPLEQHLGTFFGIRAKIVTEAENVIKYNMRTIKHHSIALLAQTQCITRSQ